MATTTYADKLKDPRWQKKRLFVLQRDNWTCQECGDKESTLHVHHNQYKGDPWDIASDKLTTLCENCHSATHSKATKRKVLVVKTSDAGKKPKEVTSEYLLSLDFRQPFIKNNIPPVIQHIYKLVVKYQGLSEGQFSVLCGLDVSYNKFIKDSKGLLNDVCLQNNIILNCVDERFGINTQIKS